MIHTGHSPRRPGCCKATYWRPCGRARCHATTTRSRCALGAGLKRRRAPVVVSWYSWTPICNEISALASRYNQVPWGGRTHLRLAGGDHALPAVCARYGPATPEPLSLRPSCRWLPGPEVGTGLRGAALFATGIRSDQWDWYIDMLALQYSQWLDTLAAERPQCPGVDWVGHLAALHTAGQLRWVPAFLGATPCVESRQ